MACENHLKQIGLAIHDYHGIHGSLPVSIGPWGDGRPTRQRNGKGWIVGILPHLEQQPLYEQLRPGFNGDFFSGRGMRDPNIFFVMQTPVALLHCPSDPSGIEISTLQQEFIGRPVSLTNYKGVLGDHQLGGAASKHRGTLPDLHQLTGCNGLFFRLSYQEPQRFAMVTDGLSQTYMVGEDVPGHNHRSTAFYANGDHAACHAPPNYFPKPPTPDTWENVVSFRSRHRGGLQFLMADGSVKFVSDSIEHDLYRRLSTKAGGSPADEILGTGN
jgi:prepilin-type processing-associated H-X9-DG protein